MNDGRLARWHKTRETLCDLLAWLDETRQWVETATAAEAPRDTTSGQVVPAENTAASETAPALAVAVPPSETTTSPEAATGSPDLFALLAALTALRQEIKLQTRSARNDREQGAQALEALTGAVDQLGHERQEEVSRHVAAVNEASRAAVETLVDLHDALSRATRQAGSVVASAATTLRGWSTQGQAWERRDAEAQGNTTPASSTPPEADDVSSATSPGTVERLWDWLGRLGQRAVSEPVTSADSPDLVAELRRRSDEAARVAARLEGLDAGYALSLRRLERALAAYGIEPITCLGNPVDAELMEVVDIVSDTTQPSGVVIDEVQRGYRRHGRVYRFAQVVATRATLPDGDAPLAAEEEENPPV